MRNKSNLNKKSKLTLKKLLKNPANSNDKRQEIIITLWFDKTVRKMASSNIGIARVEGKIVSEKLAVFTFNDVISEPEFRRYFIDKWKTLTLQMENSTILFIGGIHGYKFGNLGPNENIISLTNQV